MVITRKFLHETVLNKIYDEMSYATVTSPTQKLPWYYAKDTEAVQPQRSIRCLIVIK